MYITIRSPIETQSSLKTQLPRQNKPIAKSIQILVKGVTGRFHLKNELPRVTH